MARTVRIVTDSSAQFMDSTVVQRYNVTVIPLRIQIGGKLYQEDHDLDSDKFFRKLAESRTVPSPSTPALIAPDVDQFADAYARLNRETDQILSLHLSRAMHPTWQNAKAATQTLLGRCEIAVVDSKTTSVGLGMLVEAAGKLAAEGKSLDEVVRAVRAMIARIYAIFYVESLDYLQQGSLVSESQAILGTMLGIKPFLTIEDGELMTMEKVRTRPQAIDKLVEFVTEFASVEKLVILQSTPHATDQTRNLRERLTVEFEEREFPMMVYKPSLGTFIGPDATGIIVFEGEEDVVEDDLDDVSA